MTLFSMRSVREYFISRRPHESERSPEISIPPQYIHEKKLLTSPEESIGGVGIRRFIPVAEKFAVLS